MMAREKSSKIILFDGYCNLCSGTVQFILKRDRLNRFQFASLQGEFGKQTLHRLNLSGDQLNSVILIDGDTYYTQSTAALMVVRNLSGLWPMLYVFIVVPVFIRDRIYNWVARNRYRWFGRHKTCWIPKSEWTNRFLDTPQG